LPQPYICIVDIAYVDSYNIIGIINNDDINISDNYICKYESIYPNDTKISLIGSNNINYYIKPIKKFKGFI
jgi:hypothetical protein